MYSAIERPCLGLGAARSRVERSIGARLWPLAQGDRPRTLSNQADWFLVKLSHHIYDPLLTVLNLQTTSRSHGAYCLVSYIVVHIDR